MRFGIEWGEWLMVCALANARVLDCFSWGPDCQERCEYGRTPSLTLGSLTGAFIIPGLL
jgi:hypothetical protein